MMRGAFPTAALALLLSACSVLEDRSQCPCRLSLHCGIADPKPVGLDLTSGPEVLHATFDSGEQTKTFLVQRGTVEVVSYCGVENCRLDGNVLSIPCGSEMDPLLVCSRTVNTESESASDTLVFHKEYSTLILVMNNLPDSPHPYAVTVESCVSAVDISESRPLSGEFSV